MKKYVALLLAVLLIANVSVMSVSANVLDPFDTPSTEASDSDTTESATSASETESTTGSTESTTGSTEPTTGSTESTTGSTAATTAGAFSARVQSALMLSSGMMEITYSSSDGSAPTAVAVAGKTVELTSAGGGKALVAQTKLPYGTRSAVLVFAKGSAPFSYARTGTADTLMQISVSGKNVVAYLYDETFKLPVANASISIAVDGRSYASQKTNSDGNVTFSGVLPADKAVTVKCVFDTATIAGVTYNGQTGIKNVSASEKPTTTTASGTETTGTTLPSASHTAGTTNATVFNTLTTAVEGEMVWTDVIVDTNLLSAMQMQDYSSFAGKAKVQLSKQNYDTLTEAYKGAIFAKLAANTEFVVNEDMIKAAIKGNKDFAGMKTDSIVSLPFTFSLQAVGAGVDESIATGVQGMTYTVTMPVPESMADTDRLAVALVGSNALYDLRPLTEENGTITFTVDDLDHYALIGFTKTAGAVVGDGNSAVVWIVLLYVLGALLILGAVVLLLWPILWPWVQQKFFAKKEEPEAETLPEEQEPAAEESADEPAEEETVVVEETVILPPPLDDFPAIPVEKKEPVADVSLGDFAGEATGEKSGIDIEL